MERGAGRWCFDLKMSETLLLSCPLESRRISRKPIHVDADPASLDFEHDQAVAGMDQDEVGLAIGRPAVAVALPGHRVDDGPFVGQPLEGAMKLAFGPRRCPL